MKRNRTLVRSLLAAALAAVLVGAGPARGQHAHLKLTPESRLWIDGTSTVNSFTCEAGELTGAAALTAHAPATSRTSAQGQAEAQAWLQVPVRTFDCGKTRMNEDMYAALKAEAHPAIRFELTGAEVLAAPSTAAGTYRLRVTGRLSLAGTERTIHTIVTGAQLPGGRLRARGRLPLLMTDFGIKPPSAIAGLIRAHNRIVVGFDLITTAHGGAPTSIQVE